MAVGDEDVRHVPVLGCDPAAEHTRLIFRHSGVGEDRVLAAVDQRAGHGREPLRLSVRKKTVLWRRVVDEHVVGEVPGLVHDWACPGCWFRASMALTVVASALPRTRLPPVVSRISSSRPLRFLPSRTTTTSTSVVPSGRGVRVYVCPERRPHRLESVVVMV